MSHSLLIAFVMFAIVMFFTPGPNNIMLLSSGLTYGFRRTLPHIAGVTVGVAFMLAAVILVALTIVLPLKRWASRQGGVAPPVAGGIAYFVGIGLKGHPRPTWA